MKTKVQGSDKSCINVCECVEAGTGMSQLKAFIMSVCGNQLEILIFANIFQKPLADDKRQEQFHFPPWSDAPAVPPGWFFFLDERLRAV